MPAPRRLRASRPRPWYRDWTLLVLIAAAIVAFALLVMADPSLRFVHL